MKLFFHINYHTQPGENLHLDLLENDSITASYALHYGDGDDWSVAIDYLSHDIVYKYRVSDDANNTIEQEFVAHVLQLPPGRDTFIIHDTWNAKNFPENYLNNKILGIHLRDVAFEQLNLNKEDTNLFRLEAPVYDPAFRVVILGSVAALGNWDAARAVPMMQTSRGVWEVALTLDEQEIEYKYGLQRISDATVELEYGENRELLSKNGGTALCIQADHFYRFEANQMYRAAGVAVPVFSLRSDTGFGVGEFQDLKKLADWAHRTELSMLQILPINDTTANYSWTDSYPYAAISVYALHPQYLSIDALPFGLTDDEREAFEKERIELNKLRLIDYEQMISGKWKYIRAIFEQHKTAILKDKDFLEFIETNAAWLVPYAVFCVQRDQNKTPDFNQWKNGNIYSKKEAQAFFSNKHADHETAMLHAWVQYQLHLQLKHAVDYAHTLGISVKGDLPIGIYRYSVEAWTEPELFGMDFQAGAPPDQFTELGQNWEFPTYNWEAMKADGYRWWKNRFQALEQYFDAMRIDHILGFFRIWRMPMDALQGILGYFYPAVPVRLEEFEARGISFDRRRFCQPFINEDILLNYFGDKTETTCNQFFITNGDGTLAFKPEYNTQRKIADYFKANPADRRRDQLLTLAANVLFLEQETEDGTTVYHPRFNLDKTDSYFNLNEDQQRKLTDLYVDYFFHRQDDLWQAQALEKLPVILNATDMLICGEDLGLVPESVPVVMDRLGITALKVQRMPPGDGQWYDPAQAGYMNVVTASSHDSSTLRQWWKEDRAMTQHYFRYQLHQPGTAPEELQPALAEMILKQHLYTDAMLAIFPIQEFMATDADLVNEYIDEERINVPAVFPHYWRYRMHLNINELIANESFNEKISYWIADSNRA